MKMNLSWIKQYTFINTIVLFWQVGATVTHGAKHLPVSILNIIFYSWIISILLLIFECYRQSWRELNPNDIV